MPPYVRHPDTFYLLKRIRLFPNTLYDPHPEDALKPYAAKIFRLIGHFLPFLPLFF
jgi:hypothetical protein